MLKHLIWSITYSDSLLSNTIKVLFSYIKWHLVLSKTLLSERAKGSVLHLIYLTLTHVISLQRVIHTEIIDILHS